MRHSFWQLLFIGAFCQLACHTPQKAAPIVSPPYRLIAYASDLMPQSSARMLTHVNFSFANIKQGEVFIEPKDRVRLSRMHRIKADNPTIQILISVGGWGWSDGFSDAALTDSSRHRFARSAIRVMTKYKLDGIDIDWEYPAQAGDNNPHRPEDTHNYTLLLQTLRQYIDGQTIVDKRPENHPYLLTVATAANQRFLDLTEMDIASQYLDFVNLMTYDFRVGSSPHTGHHANLSQPDTSAQFKRSAKQAITQHISAGVPKDKLVVGAAFYGRGWEGVEKINNGLYQKIEGKAHTTAYKDLVAGFASLRGTQHLWDSTAQASYLWNAEMGLFYSYEDSLSLQMKADYVREMDLGGMMFWHIKHDTADVLLGSIYRRLQE